MIAIAFGAANAVILLLMANSFIQICLLFYHAMSY